MAHGPRTIVVTGAGGVVGRAVTHGFLGQGDSVIAVGRSQESLDSLNDAVRGAFGAEVRLHLCQVDLLDVNAPNFLSERVSELREGDIVLVNNARNLRNVSRMVETRSLRAAFQSEHELGVAVPFELSVTLSERFGSALVAVINVGSQYGLVAQNPLVYEDYAAEAAPHYGTTKAALFHLTRELSVRLAGFGTRVNAIALGGIKGRASNEFEERYRKMLPLGRMLEPADVVGPVLFLASPSARAVTGHTLAVTGGWEIV